MKNYRVTLNLNDTSIWDVDKDCCVYSGLRMKGDECLESLIMRAQVFAQECSYYNEIDMQVILRDLTGSRYIMVMTRSEAEAW